MSIFSTVTRKTMTKNTRAGKLDDPSRGTPAVSWYTRSDYPDISEIIYALLPGRVRMFRTSKDIAKAGSHR